jgi:hypothetical protein
MIALIPVLVALAGALLYGLAANPKVAEIGRLMFACGLLVFLFGVAGHSVKLL